MRKFRLKYLVFHFLLLVAFSVHSQSNEATVTIIGNALNNTGNQFNPVQNNEPPPPEQRQFSTTDQNIEPTLENGFHMRFQVESNAAVKENSMASSGSSSGIGGGIKAHKRLINFSQRTFNAKKKIRNKLPKRKKKYHPTLCEKFR